MALEPGDARLGTGLAGKMAEEMKAAIPDFELKHAWKGINAQAKAIIEYLTDNAVVTGVQSGTDTGSLE